MLNKKTPIAAFLIAAALLMCSCAPAAGTETVKISITNDSAVPYSQNGTSFQIFVDVTPSDAKITFEIIPKADGIKVENDTVTVDADVPDGTHFTVKATASTLYSCFKNFVYGADAGTTDISGVTKTAVKSRQEAVYVYLPDIYTGELKLNDRYGNVISPVCYSYDGRRLTLKENYISLLTGENRVTVRNGGKTFEVNVTVFDDYVSTCEEFAAIGKDEQSLSKAYILKNDIDFEEFLGENGDGYNGGNGLAPTGIYNGNHFKGLFDGNGHVLKNVRMIYPSADGGLFGCIDQNATVRNLGVASGYFYLAGSYSGVFAGYVSGSIRNCFVRDVTVKGGSRTSGFIGKESNAKAVENCYVSITVEERIGALFAYYSKTALLNCFAEQNKSYPFLCDNTRGGDITTSGIKTAEEMKSAATYVNWPKDIFDITDGQYPTFVNGGGK